MQPADDIKKLIDESRIISSSQVDRRILADALEDLERRRANRATSSRPGVWRIVMNTRTGKLAVAAAIVIAVLIGLQFIGGSTVTFAQAIQPILNASTAILDIVVGAEDANTPVIHDMVVGSRIRRTVSIAPEAVSIIDLQTSRMLVLDESKKEAVYIQLKGLPPISNYLDHLKNIFVKLQESPHFVIEDLGVREIDGRHAVGFLARHAKAEVTLWADSETGLPIRIEDRAGQLLVIAKNLHFDVPVEDALFSMEVPEGYRLQEEKAELDLLGSTEADFIEGLRVLAETVGNGGFPDGVAVDDYLKQVPVVQKRIEELQLSDEQEMALGMTIQKYLLFTRFFQGEGKWYYRGKGVKLGEAEKPIFWYRPKNSATYRVIYGDLHIEDVAVENLPEPLAADDVTEVQVSYQQWSKPEFVGSQEDYWYVLADGRIRVKAYLTLMKGPKDTSLMPVRLPYADVPLEAVLLGDQAGQPAKDIVSLPFQKTGDGTYDIELPVDKLSAGRTTIICQWHVSLDAIKFEQGNYRTVLQSLIPVISYKLKVGVDPQSSFELTKKATDMWVTPFTWGTTEKPGTEFGSCGLMIQKRP